MGQFDTFEARPSVYIPEDNDSTSFRSNMDVYIRERGDGSFNSGDSVHVACN